MRSAATIVLLLGLASTFAMDDAEANPDLEEARKLLDDLFVEKAGAKFKEALERGDSDVETTAEIHLGLGQVAATLGDEKKAFQSFKRALAIDTLLDLPPGTSPKVAQPLQNARALFRKGAKQIALGVNLDTSNGVRANATVLSDPFEMVGGISVEMIDSDGDTETKKISTSADNIPIPLTADAQAIVVSLIDKHGNKLATNEQIELPEGKRVGDPNGEGKDEGKDTGKGEKDKPKSGGSFITSWVLWAGLAGVAAGTGTGFGLWTRKTISDIEDKIDDSPGVEFSDVLDLEEKAKQRALIANISFGVAGAFAVAAVVFFITDGDGEPAERQTTFFTPVIGPDEVGVSATMRF